MRKESRRNCDRFGECRDVVFITKQFGQLACEQAFRSLVTLRKAGQVELLGRRLNNLTRDRSCRPFPDGVNTIFFGENGKNY